MESHGHQFRSSEGSRFGSFLPYRRKKRQGFGDCLRIISWTTNKRHLRADGLILLPSALRPRLLGSQNQQESEAVNSRLRNLKNTEQSDSHFWAIFTANRGTKRQTLTKIVVMTTILFGFSVFLANFAIPVSAASLTLTLPSDPLSINLSPVDSFKESGTSSVSIATTDANWGYSFSIKAKDTNTLKNGEYTINSISQNYTLENFKNNAPANTWGFKPSKKDSADNTSYLPAPTSSETLIEKTTANSSSATNYTFSIAAKIDSSLKHGEYSNTFVLTVIANTASYSITYNLNGGESGPGPQTDTTTEESITLDSTTPTRSGYEFLGWCTNNPGTSTSCSGTTYQPGSSYTLPNENTNTPLYAIWKSNIPNMEDFKCSSISSVSGTAEVMNGDQKITIVKMKDGKCWSKSDVGDTTWANASSLCKSPWRLPSQSDFNGLIRAYYPSASVKGTGGYSYDFSGDASVFTSDWDATSGNWWSSTTLPSDTSHAHSLHLDKSSIGSYHAFKKTGAGQVRCVSSV